MTKLTNDAESTADGDDGTGVDLTYVLARVTLLWMDKGFIHCFLQDLGFSCWSLQTGFGLGNYNLKSGTTCTNCESIGMPPWMSAIRRLYVSRLSCETLTRLFCVITDGCTANVPFSECNHATCKN